MTPTEILDREILMQLQLLGGDVSVVRLSRSTGGHAASLASRCKRMEREGLVETYRPTPDARLHVKLKGT